jgi:hypothetical protein
VSKLPGGSCLIVIGTEGYRVDTLIAQYGLLFGIPAQTLSSHAAQGQRWDTKRHGTDCRDAFLSLAKTCDKVGIALWDFLGSRFKSSGMR